jgi:hypothetical protein
MSHLERSDKEKNDVVANIENVAERLSHSVLELKDLVKDLQERRKINGQKR